MTINKNAMKNLFKIFFLCVAVAFCAACDGEQGAGGSTELPSLQMTVDKTVVQANSDDYVTVTVTGENGVITDLYMLTRRPIRHFRLKMVSSIRRKPVSMSSWRQMVTASQTM